jgi:hypothetical protein
LQVQKYTSKKQAAKQTGVNEMCRLLQQITQQPGICCRLVQLRQLQRQINDTNCGCGLMVLEHWGVDPKVEGLCR